MNTDVPAYGLWPLVVINAAVFIIFAFSFARPQTGRDWRSFGAFSAFIVALFTEMYGFPLTIYLLSGWLGSAFPGINLLSHNTGHLWETLMGWTRAVVQEFIRVIKPGGVVIYAFCSLPEGPLSTMLKYVMAKSSSKEGPLTHLLSKEERPFHRCEYSSLKQFAGGLTTVAMVGKCCTVTDELVACRLREPATMLIEG